MQRVPAGKAGSDGQGGDLARIWLDAPTTSVGPTKHLGVDMTHLDEAQPQPSAADAQTINLPRAAAELLDVARESRAGRAGRTLIPGPGAALKQTLMALAAGESLADHDSPGAATLQVLVGVVRLTGGGGSLELHPGDHAPIPPTRHGLDALEDAVMLISVGQGAREAGGSETALLE